MNLLQQYQKIRSHTISICKPLKTEDYVVQPIVDVSPPKWHLGHTTWFFETFVLKPYANGYLEYDPSYNFVFNSYYETVGTRVIRTDRGNLSRPSVGDIYQYREHVDSAMEKFLQKELSEKETEVLITGFNHEQQHQELLLTDIKYILGNNPLFPPYSESYKSKAQNGEGGFLSMRAGLYEIGYEGDGFCFDNELEVHNVYLNAYKIAKSIVTNGEYLQFMEAAGYENFNYWHSDGWQWVKENHIKAPMYWHKIDGEWCHYTFRGLEKVQEDEALCHISYYEAFAYASWRGMRLPTEAEWEAAAGQFEWGTRWEWTESAYLPYPGFSKAPGALGEYNGKFMINQMVLRGASEVTSENHSRTTYRNFFQPNLRWQFTGIRLAI